MPEELEQRPHQADVLLVGVGVPQGPVVDHQAPGQADQAAGHAQHEDAQLQHGVDPVLGDVVLVVVMDAVHHHSLRPLAWRRLVGVDPAGVGVLQKDVDLQHQLGG